MKLTKAQRRDLRWETWPYSEVNVITQTRILDDSVSRTMKYIEIVINPLTFEIVAQNIDTFDKKLNIVWLVNCAQDRWRAGYVVMASPEMEREPWAILVDEMIEAHRRNAEKSLIAMHVFAMKLLGLKASW